MNTEDFSLSVNLEANISKIRNILCIGYDEGHL